jgi:vacuolar protein sorting-associated protein 13A/C
MHLTANQYAFLLDLSRSIPSTFATTEEEEEEDHHLVAQATANNTPARVTSPSPAEEASGSKESETIDLFPELAKVAFDEQGEKVVLYSKLEFAFTLKTIYLEIYTKEAQTQEALKRCTLACFSLNDVDVKHKMVSNGSMEAEVLLRSFVSSCIIGSSDGDS